MNHGAEVVASGTLQGHLYFAAFALFWALVWVLEDARRGRGGDDPLETGLVMPLAKTVLPLIAAWLEVPNSGWYPMDRMAGWAHVIAYTPIAFAGMVDLLARRGLMARRAGYLATAGALLNAAMVFASHDHAGGVVDVVHGYLELALLVTALFLLIEWYRPSEMIGWFKRGAMTLTGVWLLTLSWILYLSGWDLGDHISEGWAGVLFSYNVVGVAVAFLALYVAMGRGRESTG